jgi:putative FmdB family regulatory protein
MPVYEYRCRACAAITTQVSSVAARASEVTCEHCGGQAKRIISGSAVKLSSASKLARLDPKYDRMADAAMRSNPKADPDHLLKKMKPFGKPDS